MFEVGFSEIVLILGLALLVLGPEKLPGLAAKVGRWTGRARAMARQLQTQLEQEVTLDELAKSKPKPDASQPSTPDATTTTAGSDPTQQPDSEHQSAPPWTQAQNDHSNDSTAGTAASPAEAPFAETHAAAAHPADVAARTDSHDTAAADAISSAAHDTADGATTKTGQ
jgi:sec-independent protein translocase protein TatB